MAGNIKGLPRPPDLYQAQVIADSISTAGVRLTSVEVTMARFVLAELNTHRMFSRNSASSRAIPVSKQLRRVIENTYMPQQWGIQTAGMAAKDNLSPELAEAANAIWDRGLCYAVISSVGLIGGFGELDQDFRQLFAEHYPEIDIDSQPALDADNKVHKQLANRLLEPFCHHTVLITASQWDNFFGQRIDAAAQPEIKRAAELIKQVIDKSQPTQLKAGQWHLPYVDDELRQHLGSDQITMGKIASARAARLSYLNQQQHLDRQKNNLSLADIVKKDVELHDRLVSSGHMSPLEHVATPFTDQEWSAIKSLQAQLAPELSWLSPQLEFHGNFRGWHQYRKSQADEDNFALKKQKLN